MAIIKCKMCGGDIELTADKTFGTCEFCGSTMTLPKVDDDQRAAAFNRGNHFRRIGEFDKALAVYERIVREDDTDAEAHWCCALCRFGIEYVEDPATYEYMPTCHRASFHSFLEDVDYLAAVEHSEGITKRQYQKDGAKIAEVQRGILTTSQNAEPYDVFICYKESDENGDRTRDSLLAQDIYYQLTEQGRKVFFARITLEDVAGAQYEPYIFAALNSAKVMIVVGTKPEYLNAVWVKNEWSRFLAMMKKDRHKLLLPCYRDMDPYDMPEQLSVLQSYDMAKIGFIQDLTRGIAKVLDADKKPEPAKETVVVQQTAGADIAPLLKRAFMFLEDEDWKSADEYCEKVLDIDPENAQAYLGKLMAELRVSKQENLKNCAESFDESGNYQKALRFGDAKLKAGLIGSVETINFRRKKEKEEALLARKKILLRISAARERIKPAQGLVCAAKGKIIGLQADGTTLISVNSQREIYNTGESFWTDLVAIAAGEDHTVGLRSDGTAVAEGYYSSDQCNISGWTDLVAIAAGDGYAVGLRSDGTAVATGGNSCGRCNVTGWTDLVAIAAGSFHTVGLRSDGTPVATGDNSYGQCEVSGWTDLVAIAAAEKHTVGLRSDGTAVATSNPFSDQCDVSGWTDLVAIAAGNGHVVGLRADGTAVATGKNDKRQCNVSGWTNLVAVAAGTDYTVGLRSDGTVVVDESSEDRHTVAHWKLFDDLENREHFGEKLRLTKEKSRLHVADKRNRNKPAQGLIAAMWLECEEILLGVRADGTLVHQGNGKFETTTWTDLVAVAAGSSHIVGLRSDGTAVASGEALNGECCVSSWKNLVAVAAGTSQTVGLRSDGTVERVGNYYNGVRDVSGWTDLVAIDAGWDYTIGLRSDGTAVSIGLCDVSYWKDLVAIAAGEKYTVGLRSDGTAVATGDNRYGQCNVFGWTDLVAIAADYSHTVGLRSDGTAVATGDNRDGQCDVSGWTDLVAIAAGGGLTVGLRADGTTVCKGKESMKLFESIDTVEQEFAEARKARKEQQRRRDAGCCLHCGGNFKGLFVKKCENCGKPKDY